MTWGAEFWQDFWQSVHYQTTENVEATKTDRPAIFETRKDKVMRIICMEACLAHADNWPQWRGIGSAEVSPEKNLPMT